MRGRPRACSASVPARIDALQRPLFAPPSRDDAATLDALRSMATVLAAHFDLRYASIAAEAEGVVGHFGICYADGRIRIRMRHATTGRLLKESSLVDTLCHELAHLKHLDHSLRFRGFYEKILAEARRRGWYRPGPRAVAAP